MVEIVSVVSWQDCVTIQKFLLGAWAKRTWTKSRSSKPYHSHCLNQNVINRLMMS